MLCSKLKSSKKNSLLIHVRCGFQITVSCTRTVKILSFLYLGTAVTLGWTTQMTDGIIPTFRSPLRYPAWPQVAQENRPRSNISEHLSSNCTSFFCNSYSLWVYYVNKKDNYHNGLKYNLHLLVSAFHFHLVKSKYNVVCSNVIFIYRKNIPTKLKAN